MTTEQQATQKIAAPKPVALDGEQAVAEPVDDQAALMGVMRRLGDEQSRLSPADGALLQRTLGNRATGALLGSKSSAESIQNASASSFEAILRRVNDLGVQAKLTVGPVDDPHEKEADAVAKQVVQRINRQEDDEEISLKHIMRQEDDEELGLKRIQREVAAPGDPMLDGGEVNNDIETGIRSAKGGGSPLADSVRKPMESAFNANFGNVKVHTDSASDSLNKSVSAKAFTTGSDIFFRSDSYDPSSTSGQELIAHELTHVVQQSGSGIDRDIMNRENLESTVQRSVALEIQRDDEPGRKTPGAFTVTSLTPLIDEIELNNEQSTGVGASQIGSTPNQQSGRVGLASLLEPDYEKLDFTVPISAEGTDRVRASQAHFDRLGYSDTTRQLSGVGSLTVEILGLNVLNIPVSIENNKLVGEYKIASHTVALPDATNKVMGGVMAGVLQVKDNALEMKLAGDLDIELPGVGSAEGVKTDVIYNKKSGYRVETLLSSPIAVGEMLEIESLNAQYGATGFAVGGIAHIKDITGIKPFRAPINYSSSAGLTIESERIDLDLPKLAGIQPTGYLSDLSYVANEGKFAGKGRIEAPLPVVGTASADVVVENNKIANVRLAFERDGISIPNKSAPLITGESSGEILFNNGVFERGTVAADLKIDVPGKEGSSREGDLRLEGTLADNELNAKIRLAATKRIPVHDYVELSDLEIAIHNGDLSGGGEFSVTKIKDIEEKIPIGIDKSGGLKSSDKQDDQFGDEKKLWGSLNYGFDLKRGFHARGIGNVLLANGVVASGMLAYNSAENRFTLLAEVGNAPLLKQKTFTKPLFDKHVSVSLMKFGALGGIYGEAGAKLDFNAAVGPVTLDADGLMTNIDLFAMRGDIEELNVSVTGGAQATIDGAPYFGLGAWFVVDALANVKGGLKIPMEACLSTEAIGSLEGMQYKDGEFKGPSAELSLPLIFRLKAEAMPYAHLHALNGLIDQDVAFASLGKKDLVKPRKLLDLKLNLNKPEPEKAVEEPPSLDSAPVPNAQELELVAASSCDPVTNDAPEPSTVVTGDPGSDLALPEPIDLKQIVDDFREKMGGDEWIKRADSLVQGIDHVSKQLGWSVTAVMSWLEEYGVMDKLRSASAQLQVFGDKLKEATGSSYALLWDVATTVFADLSQDESSEALGEEASTATVSEASAIGETRTLALKLGPSTMKLIVPVKPNETVTGTIPEQSNRLAKDGFAFGMGSVKYDNDGQIISGSVSGNLVINPWATLSKVDLELESFDESGATIVPEFTDAEMEATEQLNRELGELPKKASGSFESTQTRLVALKLGHKGTFKLPAPVGETGLEAEEKAEFGFEKTAKDWLITSRAAVMPFEGGRFKAEFKDHAVAPSGVSGTGKLTLEVDALGAAEASAKLAGGEFEKMALKFRSKPVTLPEDDPMLSAQVTGALTVENGTLVESTVDLKSVVTHKYLNAGQPFGLVGSADFGGYFAGSSEVGMPAFSSALTEGQSISLLKGMVNLTQLAFVRDSEGKFDLTGAAALPSLGGQLSLTYASGNFGMVATKLPKKGPLNITEFNMEAGADGWGLGGKAIIDQLAGFGRIEAGIYYRAGKLGMLVSDAKPPDIPGVAPTIGIDYLEYDPSGLFNGHGKLGVALPVVGYGEADLTIKDNKLERAQLHMQSTDQINVPSASPYISGSYDGNIIYDEGSLAGSLSGELSFGAPGIEASEKPKLKFALNAGSGITGFIKQEEETGKINEYLQLTAVDLKISQKERYSPLFFGVVGMAMLHAMQNQPQFDPAPTIAATRGLWNGYRMPRITAPAEKYTSLDGTGALSLDLGDRGSGGMKLSVTDNEFSFEQGSLKIGSPTDPFHGEVTASFSNKQGLEFDAKLDAELTQGLRASGTIAYRQSADKDKALDAVLSFEQPIWETALEDDITIADTSVSATILPLGPVFIYGKAGIKLGFGYKVDPLRLDGSAAVSGIDLKNREFERAIVSLQTKGGAITASLKGKPSLGLGAKLVSEYAGMVEGGVDIPITAGLKAEPQLKTAVTYERGGKAKGKVDLNVPLAFGIKAAMTPTLKASILSIPLIDTTLDPIAEFDLMQPRTIFNMRINLGNVEETAAQKIGTMASTSEKDMAPASNKMAEEQATKTDTEKSEPAPKAESGVGDSMGNTAPFNFGMLSNKLKAPMAYVGNKAASLWKATKAAAETVGQVVTAAVGVLKNPGQAALKGAQKIGSVASSAVEYGAETLTSIASWLWATNEANPEQAAQEIQADIRDSEAAPIILGKLGGSSLLKHYGVSSAYSESILSESFFASMYGIPSSPMNTEAMMAGPMSAMGFGGSSLLKNPSLMSILGEEFSTPGTFLPGEESLGEAYSSSIIPSEFIASLLPQESGDFQSVPRNDFLKAASAISFEEEEMGGLYDESFLPRGFGGSSSLKNHGKFPSTMHSKSWKFGHLD